MFLTVHASIGALIGQQISSPLWAFILGLISHFLLDLIPHGDRAILPKEKIEEKIKLFLIIASVDFIIMISFLGFFYLRGIFTNPIVIGSAVLGSILPDFLNGIYYLLKNNQFFKTFHHFHGLIHDLIKKELSFATGLVFQIIIWLIIQGQI